ncbi:MAG: hypothetical protein AVDCRST_MAG04-2998 [uncultured Acetobacteraceae bacterium]|uniref:Uncharacterized protein n=1 Tax=uncultured Acetobacteraceae bacterium TaxID=169975 RepID=A0A6J4J2I2_9PROT|nr:MAG: hypothetical protein AVDCRST_MAG04-2998 [uncultured Acetobacteraceae bacterium]
MPARSEARANAAARNRRGRRKARTSKDQASRALGNFAFEFGQVGFNAA